MSDSKMVPAEEQKSHKARKGLGYIQIGLILMAFAYLSDLIVFGYLLKWKHDEFLSSVGFSVVALVFMAAGLFGFAGKCFCLESASADSGKTFALLAVIFEGLAVITRIAKMIVYLPEWFDSVPSYIAAIGLMFFLLFLRSLAMKLVDEKLKAKSQKVLACLILTVVSIGISTALANLFPSVALGVVLLGLLLGLITFCGYAGLLRSFGKKLRLSGR